MNRQELEQKLKDLLLGKEFSYNMSIASMIVPVLKDWFNDTQGYYGLWINNYTFTITYKDRHLVEFKVKYTKVRLKNIIKDIVIDQDFEETQPIIDKLEEDIINDYHKVYLPIEANRNKALLKMFKAVRKEFPNTPARELLDMFHHLSWCHTFWQVERMSLTEGGNE